MLRHANRKHDVVAALITDPREAEMPPAGLVTLEDAETGADAARRHAVGGVPRPSSRARATTRQHELRDQLRATGHGPRRVRRVGLDGRSAAAVLPRARAEAAPMKRAARARRVVVACGHSSVARSDRRPTPIEPREGRDREDHRERPGQGDRQRCGRRSRRSAIRSTCASRSRRPPASASMRRSRRPATSGSAGSTSSGSRATRSATPDGGQHQQQTYTLEAPSSGKPAHPAAAARDGRRARTTRAATRQAAGDPDRRDPARRRAGARPRRSTRELKPALGELDPDVGGTPWIVILGIVGGVADRSAPAACSLCRALARARAGSPQQRSAYDEAVAQLARARGRAARPTPTTPMRGSSSCRRSCARYLERRYEIRAPELTTEEFLQVATRAPELDRPSTARCSPRSSSAATA